MPEGKIDQVTLKKLVQSEIPVYEKKRQLNQFLGLGVGLLGIALGLGATVAGIVKSDDARIAAIFGACAATTQAILFAFPVDKRAAVYRILATKSKNLDLELQIQELPQERLHEILEALKAISLEAALEEASPGKVEEAKNFDANGHQHTSVHQTGARQPDMPASSASN